MAHDLTTFIVPDARLARAAGLDPEEAGLRPVATPRHATVLLVVGPIPEKMASAAGVVYAQMPRPRAILAAGVSSIAGLPEPDVVTALDQEALRAGVAELRRELAAGAFDPGAEAPEIAAALTRTEYVCPMHPEVVRAEPGICPIRGMDLAARETAGAPAEQEHDHAGMMASAKGAMPAHQESDGMDHGEHGAHDTMPMDHGEHGAPASSMDHAAMGHTMGNGGGMDHGMMDHSMHGGGFMSMVAMTENLPRSADGLPMEWVEAPFGPLFPGLPGGLDLTLTLDGDGVARATAATGATARGLAATWAGPIETFPDRLARLDPLAPVAYRLLARRALEAVAGIEIGERAARARVRAAEWERIGSHLGWLAELGASIGDRWLAERAADLQVAVVGTTGEPPPRLVREIRDFSNAAARAPLLGRRLSGIGVTEAVDADDPRGPVARAAGLARDARLGDAWYRPFGFQPVILAGGDALARFQVRLAEIVASLDLVLAAAANGHQETAREAPLPPRLSGAAAAEIETPRGMARLRVTVEDGSVAAAEVDPPSAAHIRLVPDITARAEVADALVAVASLDLSPWEVAQ